MAPYEASVHTKAYAALDLGVDVTVGPPLPFDFNSLANVKFASIEGGVYGDFSLPLPVESSAPGYTGPTWALGLYSEGSLKPELTNGLLKDLLDFVKAPAVTNVDLALFDATATLPLKSSPVFTISTNQTSFTLGSGGSVNLSLSADGGVAGTASFVDQLNSASTTNVLTAESFSGNSIVFDWSPQHKGTHVIAAQAQTDWLSKILPYASVNSVSVQVSAGSPGPSVTPIVSAVSPTPVPGSSATQTIYIGGKAFAAGATATLVDITNGGTYPDKATSFISTTQIGIDAKFTNTTAKWSVQVINPDHGASNVFVFEVQAASNPAPSIAAVTPNPVIPSGASEVLTVTGANFVSGATVTLNNVTDGSVLVRQPATVGSSAALTASAFFPNMNGSWTISVVNPDGGASAPFPFGVQVSAAPVPSIATISPSPVVAASGGSETISIQGANFATGAVAWLTDLSDNGAATSVGTSFVSQSMLLANFGFPAVSAVWSVQIVNPDGGKSNPYSIQVQPAAPGAGPTITSVSPNPVPGCNCSQTFNVYGSNFVAGANVTLRDLTANQTFSNRQSNYFSAGQITLNPNFNNVSHTWSVEVISPDGQTSGQFQFQVTATTQNPVPTISSVAPNPVPGCNCSQTFNVYGSNFVAGANVTLRDLTANQTFSNRQSSYFSAGQITLNPNFNNVSHTWSVEVINPDGQTSGQFQFQVQ
ncbi:MAG TPA: hypothetical protein VHG32_14780 [Thermoanaerobaculia bacterium]|nr:hypothetical protein [Thermoanaerobaculia bacterium]